MNTTNPSTTGVQPAALLPLHAPVRRYNSGAAGRVLGRVALAIIIPIATVLLQRAILRTPLLRAVLLY